MNNQSPPPRATSIAAEPSLSRRAHLTSADQLSAATLAAVALIAIGTICYGLDDPHAWVDLSQPITLADEAQPAAGFQLDVNRADWPEWTLLPRIGETLARRIVASKSRDGAFQSHDDIRRVAGIGPKTLENIRPYLLPLKSDTIDTSQLGTTK